MKKNILLILLLVLGLNQNIQCDKLDTFFSYFPKFGMALSIGSSLYYAYEYGAKKELESFYDKIRGFGEEGEDVKKNIEDLNISKNSAIIDMITCLCAFCIFYKWDRDVIEWDRELAILIRGKK